MKHFIKHHPWKIIEDGFNPELNQISESLFSIGNGKFGQRGNFEEKFTGQSLQGNYVAGIYYPDKTRVGWWKNGYPDYFAKVLNAPDWTGIHIKVNGESVDLAKAKVLSFKRELDMQHGLLLRQATLELKNGVRVSLETTRFCSLSHSYLGVIEYKVKVDRDAELEVESFVDGRIKNADSNYNEKFWKGVKSKAKGNTSQLITETKKTAFRVGILAETNLSIGKFKDTKTTKKYTSVSAQLKLKKDEELRIEKRAFITSSLDQDYEKISPFLKEKNDELKPISYTSLKESHIAAWHAKWAESDIVIEGDDAAQQGIRFNIFQLNCTYTGEDERLNIGPKGFTGEKYGGSTYWDTEAYCLPFYQATADPSVARNLLVYRYKHLEKAIENAEKLGFKNGAALYPMVTMNGEECHNEWEITFEEIHRNGAIAYAIYNYINYTGDKEYLREYGLEVLIGIARFWAQRVNWSESKKQYVMLGVTGPNEFENNVNNNWYTNKIAAWCLTYCVESIEWVKENFKSDFDRIVAKTRFNDDESENWLTIAQKMYYPFSEEHDVYLQQDGFLDKELIPVSKLDASDRPIVENWSWDRILRSCYIKQADVLQGFYFFEDEFTEEEHKKHYDFYEPLTVHESSLSPCVHSILAAKLGDEDRAYEFYLRTARLDLDDYNNDTRDGLHITSMAGTWMSVVMGFAGMRVRNGELSFKPFLPKAWKSFTFKIRFDGKVHLITINEHGANVAFV